jgi:signal transduction histidine kinase
LSHILKRRRGEDALQQQASRLNALNEIAHTISGLDNLDGALRNILVQIQKILPLDGFNVLLYDPDRKEFSFPLVYDSGQFWHEEPRPFAAASIAAQVLSTGEPLLISRTTEELQALTGSAILIGNRAQPSASVIMAPLAVGDMVIGTVSANSYTPNAYTAEHLTLLIGAAYQIAIAVENARLFDALRKELTERSIAEDAIRSLNADLEQRVLDRTAALQQANERLQALSQLKDEFVSNVSHELRTPLTSLKMRHYLVRTHPDQVERHLEVMERETERLHRTIEDLLQLSRLDQQRIEFSLLPTAINAVIGSYVADRELAVRARGLTLNFEARPDLPFVLADKGLLEQTLAILLTNAINYTPSGGLITVRTLMQIADGKVWAGFSVADSGPGISPADQQRLFERFFRGETARASGVAGTGLGLAIAREIIDRHGGRIEVESSGIPGEGTRFTVWLPVL